MMAWPYYEAWVIGVGYRAHRLEYKLFEKYGKYPLDLSKLQWEILPEERNRRMNTAGEYTYSSRFAEFPPINRSLLTNRPSLVSNYQSNKYVQGGGNCIYRYTECHTVEKLWIKTKKSPVLGDFFNSYRLDALWNTEFIFSLNLLRQYKIKWT